MVEQILKKTVVKSTKRQCNCDHDVRRDSELRAPTQQNTNPSTVAVDEAPMNCFQPWCKQTARSLLWQQPRLNVIAWSWSWGDIVPWKLCHFEIYLWAVTARKNQKLIYKTLNSTRMGIVLEDLWRSARPCACRRRDVVANFFKQFRHLAGVSKNISVHRTDCDVSGPRMAFWSTSIFFR